MMIALQEYDDCAEEPEMMMSAMKISMNLATGDDDDYFDDFGNRELLMIESMNSGTGSWWLRKMKCIFADDVLEESEKRDMLMVIFALCQCAKERKL